MNASYEYGLGYSCGNFDPIAGVADAINGLKGTKDKLITGAVGAVTSAIGSLPALIMQRVDPETDLKTTKIELKAVQKKAIEGDRLIARFEGQLAVYEKIEAQKKMNE